jgi:hypothetical protein
LREAVVPALVPNLLLLAATLATVAVSSGDVVTIAATGAVGLVVYTAATLRLGLRPGEARELVNTVRRQPRPT